MGGFERWHVVIPASHRSPRTMDGQAPVWETSKENVMPARRGRRVADIETAQDASATRAQQLADQQA